MRPTVLALCLALTGLGASLASPALAKRTTAARPDFSQRVLASHNQERVRLGLRPLTWSPVLAVHALTWAAEMARSGRFVHSTNDSRPGEGESMFRHITKAYTPEQMVGTFLAERPNFKPGIFPDIARDGNWMRAGHYSQVIWPTTTELGCAVAVGGGLDYFVCRYSPPGNVRKQPVGYAPN
jgi:uncharacterized protein YkwD